VVRAVDVVPGRPVPKVLNDVTVGFTVGETVSEFSGAVVFRPVVPVKSGITPPKLVAVVPRRPGAVAAVIGVMTVGVIVPPGPTANCVTPPPVRKFTVNWFG